MNPSIHENIKDYYHFWFEINALYENWAKLHGLNSNALFILYTIYENPNACTQRMICEKLLLSKQTVNAILDTFQKKGYIGKKISPKDKRNKFIVFTTLGREYADELLGSMFRLEEEAMQNMGEKERIGLLENSHLFLTHLHHTFEI